jgi:hypothetical protein
LKSKFTFIEIYSSYFHGNVVDYRQNPGKHQNKVKNVEKRHFLSLLVPRLGLIFEITKFILQKWKNMKIYLLIAKGQSTNGNMNFKKQKAGNRPRFYNCFLYCIVAYVVMVGLMLFGLFLSRRTSKSPLVK